jgi:hypothetical protein
MAVAMPNLKAHLH